MFSLAGFGNVRREGVELTSNFTATISVEMKVGTLEETVTVTGESPVVDTQNTVQQRVISKDVLDALPVGKSFNLYTALVPGAIGTATNQDVGGTKGENTQGFKIHGSRSTDFQQLRDGMFFGTLVAAGNFMSSTNPATVQEVAVETSGFSADAETGGGHINVIPRDGGNFFNGSFKADYGNNHFQSNNITTQSKAQIIGMLRAQAAGLAFGESGIFDKLPPPIRTEMMEQRRLATTAGIQRAFLVGAFFALLGLGVSTLLPLRPRQE